VVYVNPLDYNDLADASVLPGITHCPAFSGIGAEETRYDPGFRSLRIGEGKPGDILRSVLLDVSKDDRTWRNLAGEIKELFQVELKKPEYNPGQPFILCEYKERGVTYDIASAGSGFHQTLLLFAFVYGNGSENSVLMVDEPDAHLHVWLQARIADRLSALARDRNRQLILSTHAETILGDTEPSRILSFAGSPHLLSHKRDTQALGTAMRLISPLDLLLAEHGRTVLYCEDKSDFKILQAWARRLDHPAKRFFDRPFFHPLRGRRPRDARDHLWGLRAFDENMHGFLLLDRDSRMGDDHDMTDTNLQMHVWTRYEIENYLLVPKAIERFAGGPDFFRPDVHETFRAEYPASVLDDPLSDIAALTDIAASKNILPKLFPREPPVAWLPKSDYYRIAESMEPDEIHPEAIEVLDKIAALVRKSA